MKTKWYLRTLSLLLCFVLVMQLVPAQVLAADDSAPVSSAVDIDETPAPAEILAEEEDLRSETEKHFRLSDGSYIAVNYGLPVHYPDDSGEWQDIDNTLSLVTDPAGVSSYRTANGAVPTSFSASLADGDVFSSSLNNTGVTMSLLDTAEALELLIQNGAVSDEIPDDADGPADGSVPSGLVYNRDAVGAVVSDVAPLLAVSEGQGWKTEDVLPQKLHSAIRYNDVFPGVDLLYTAYSTNIKEQIVVKERQNTYRYDFLLRFQGLTAALNEDGSVSLNNADGVTVYSIPAPYMEDAAYHTSDAVSYTLTQVPEGAVLTVEADRTWINDPERAFPVVIDPTLVSEVRRSTKDETADIHATYVIQGDPTSTHGNNQQLYFGYSSYLSQKIHRIFMHFQNLPKIPEGSVVINANLRLYMLDYSYVGCKSMPIGLYEVTSDNTRTDGSYHKWIYYMKWNNQATYDTANMIDYTNATPDKDNSYLTWDMTELVKKWYIEKTANRTIALAPVNESQYSSKFCAVPVFYAYSSSHAPVLIVSYRNNEGIEPYYTYSTAGAGNAGTGYIADGSGQFKALNTLLTFSSTVNPFALNLVYNSDYFATDSTTDYQPMAKMGLSMQAGSGWTLDAVQKVVPEKIGNIDYLRYHDGDGTLHYFAKDSSKDAAYYYDEDGLGLKIQDKGSGSYVMSDDKGNTWTFTGNYLTAMADETGNQYLFKYSSGKLNSIAQKNKGGSEITVASFTYSGNNISAVKDYGGNSYAFTYSDNKLTAISKNGTKIAEYAYSGRRLTKLTDTESNYSIAVTYAGGRVSGYQELAGTAPGGQVAVTYPNYSETVYRDYGADRTKNTADDLLTHYQFDYAGRTANAYTTDNAGNILGASNAVYSGSTSTDKTNNRTLRTAAIGHSAYQQIRNSSFEDTAVDAWTLSSGMSISTAKPRTGFNALKGVATSGTISAARNSFTLFTYGTYTVTAYVNTTAMTNFSGKGIYLTATDPAGNTFTSDTVNYKTSADIDGGWVRIALTFIAKADGAHKITVGCQGAEGVFYVDDIQVAANRNAPSNRNLLGNGDFGSNTYAWIVGDNAELTEGCLKITGDPKVDTTTAYQDVAVNLPGTQTYVLSGWVKANSVPSIPGAKETSREKTCGLRATVTYTDGTTEDHYAPFNTDLPGWQFTSVTVVPKQPTKTVKTIRVTCAYEKNANVAIFDNVSLVREAAQAMKYDKDGNLVSVSTPGLKEDTDTYSGGNLIKTVTGGNGTYTYTYDTTYKHRLTKVSNGVLTQTMGYDGMGNVTSTTLTGTNADRSLQTSAKYDSTGNLLTTVTDSAGNSAIYTYGTNIAKMLGLPTSTTDGNGTKTTAEYDTFGRITKSGLESTVDLRYTYNNGMLGSLTRTADGKGQTYAFTYDAFGNRKSIKVGSKVLASYEYAAKNGNLTKQIYGNGDFVSYTYDILNRVTKATYSDGRVLTYTYTGDGQLYSVKDTLGTSATTDDLTYVYTYDSIGRLIVSEEKRGGEVVLRAWQQYDDCNRLSGQSWQVGGKTYSESYTYNGTDGTLNTMTTGTGKKLQMGYDALRRLSSVNAGIYTKNYTYRDISATQTTTQISKLSYSGVEGSPVFDYTYDGNGNILTEASGGVTTTYTYDKQNQLLSATGGGKTYTYTYDNAGNILTASDGTTTHTYEYNDPDWPDLLTAVDGMPIYYESGETIDSAQGLYSRSGNPAVYYKLDGRKFAFDWDADGNLINAYLPPTMQPVSYTYDSNGLRTGKSYGSHRYYYASGRLLRDTYGDTVLDFCYDESGKPFALTYKKGSVSTTYYYVTNLQGDVVKLVDVNGYIVASYTYDPYGKVLTATGSMADVNPLRYRGYYHDTETGFYYLQSRYYDPEIGRFISADSYASTGQGFTGQNMFAYCGNNPVFRVDSKGDFWLTVAAIAVAVGITVHDIHQITRDDELKVSLTKESDTVKINNSSRIVSPWVQYGYSAYVNHFSEYRDDIQGTSLGMTYEWGLHNLGYYGADLASTGLSVVGVPSEKPTRKWLQKTKNSCKEVNIGTTIFNDKGHGALSTIMHISYSLLFPRHAILDGSIYKMEALS